MGATVDDGSVVAEDVAAGRVAVVDAAMAEPVDGSSATVLDELHAFSNAATDAPLPPIKAQRIRSRRLISIRPAWQALPSIIQSSR